MTQKRCYRLFPKVKIFPSSPGVAWYCGPSRSRPGPPFGPVLALTTARALRSTDGKDGGAGYGPARRRADQTARGAFIKRMEVWTQASTPSLAKSLPKKKKKSANQGGKHRR